VHWNPDNLVCHDPKVDSSLIFMAKLW
jgi:hypothetical protein